MRTLITVTIHNRCDGFRWAFPARWEICSHCEGNATSTAWIEPDGGGFTGEEWAEACDDDPDFATDYFSGKYDRPCPHCNGLGRVQVIDREAVTGWRATILLREYDRQQRDSAEIDAMHEAERRMGA